MPSTTPEHDARIASLKFFSVYPHYVTKVDELAKGKAIDKINRVPK